MKAFPKTARRTPRHTCRAGLNSLNRCHHITLSEKPAILIVPAFRRSGVPAFPASRRSGVPVFPASRCSGVPAFPASRCSGVPAFPAVLPFQVLLFPAFVPLFPGVRSLFPGRQFLSSWTCDRPALVIVQAVVKLGRIYATSKADVGITVAWSDAKLAFVC